MGRSRTLTAVAGLLGSLVVSLAAWFFFDTLLRFLLVPFVPILLRRSGRANAGDRTVRVCPTCGYRTVDPEYDYCPRDGAQLE